MSVEECLRLAERRAEEERRAEGVIDEAEGVIDEVRVTIHLARTIVGFPAPRWAVHVHAHGECSTKGFYRRRSADGYFDHLKQKYGLEEAGA